MSLFEKVTEDLKAAMLAKEKDKLEALRAIKTALIHAKTEKGSSGELTTEAELAIIQKLIKQRKDSAQIFISQGREDLHNKEIAEVKAIEKYLPAQLDEKELTEKLKDIIKKVNATSSKDMGKVMGTATKELAGKAENKIIAETVRKLLNNL
ncbi:MAG: GatB/YqeY domain-containing protein [Bacteroidales bacterium]|nr:MAG: GatB/YqeY domain-containing protein [Bacteroidales bacterium]